MAYYYRVAFGTKKSNSWYTYSSPHYIIYLCTTLLIPMLLVCFKIVQAIMHLSSPLLIVIP